MAYTFLDGSGATQTADSSVVSGVIQRPIIQIGSVLSAIPVTFSGSPSISGTVTVGAITIQPSSLVSGVTSVMTGTTSVLVLTAPPATQRNYVTQILVTNAAAAGTFVNIVDNGQVIYSGYAAASGGGFSASFPTPLKQSTSVLALYAASSVQSSVVVAMSGYTTI